MKTLCDLFINNDFQFRFVVVLHNRIRSACKLAEENARNFA